MDKDILIAILSLIGALLGSASASYFSHRKTTALIAYRLEELEKQVSKHNSVIERTYALEKRAEVFDERFRVANHRIDDLENTRV